LNEAQRAAVEYDGGPLMVLAGAGSGKTRVLTARIAHLAHHRGVRPDRIMAVTFTNRAADQMKQRVAELLGREPAGLWIGTFHSLCARLLRREAHHLGFTRAYSIYDEDDRLALIKRLLERAEYSAKTFPPRQIQWIISSAKNRLLSPDELGASADDRLTRVAAEIYHEMGAALRAANAMDFDDLLLHPLTLFREHPDRLSYWQRRFDSILVDEFQDTNRAQYLLARHLGALHRDISVVGDDDQSIYSWRGAELRNLLDFNTDFPEAAVLRLEENYRSTQVILDAANGIIAENRGRLGKTLFTSRRGGEPVVVVAAADERDEAEWVARECREQATTESFDYGEMALLYRTNAQSRAFEDAFRRSAIPYRLVGAVSFYARREVRDVLAYLRLTANPADDQAFLRAIQVPRRGIGPGSLRHLQAAATRWNRPLLDTAAIADRITDLRPQAKSAFTDFAHLLQDLHNAAQREPPPLVLERIIEVVGFAAYLQDQGVDGVERLENVRELVAAAAEWWEEQVAEGTQEGDDGTPVERFLQGAALLSPVEVSEGDPRGVTLMTVHTAKGLEWPLVMVVGVEDGLFPLSRSMETFEGLEEERRLAYVAATRAQDRLYLTWARARRRGGQLMPGLPSRFLEALPPGVVEERRTSGVFGGEWYRQTYDSARWFTHETHDPDLESQDHPRYVKGERVYHDRFGSGFIAALSGQGRELKVTIQFDDAEVGTKQLLVAYAGLQRSMEGA
ncbi:MAG: UvrD-helicase domain-containing protein, partial [Gemmatimonadota bacterium]|nr:UvrD-helicase domain-containing protein [Gemmatimonadota bacterium]